MYHLHLLFIVSWQTQKKRTMIPQPKRNVAQMVVDEYQATTLNETQEKLKEMEETELEVAE